MTLGNAMQTAPGREKLSGGISSEGHASRNTRVEPQGVPPSCLLVGVGQIVLLLDRTGGEQSTNTTLPSQRQRRCSTPTLRPFLHPRASPQENSSRTPSCHRPGERPPTNQVSQAPINQSWSGIEEPTTSRLLVSAAHPKGGLQDRKHDSSDLPQGGVRRQSLSGTRAGETLLSSRGTRGRHVRDPPSTIRHPDLTNKALTGTYRARG